MFLIDGYRTIKSIGTALAREIRKNLLARDFKVGCGWMKTYTAKPEIIKHCWYCVDAEGKTLGRLATEIACRLRGKHKVEYTPHVDVGDYIIVINAEKVVVTGNKRKNKQYYRHSGYVGSIKQLNFDEMVKCHPERVIEIAVKGMLPKGPLGRSMYRKLKVYAGDVHQHVAQQPKILKI